MASTEEKEDTLTVGSAACGPRGGAGAARAAHLSWSSFRLGAAGRGRGAPRRRLRRRDNQPHRDAASTRSPAEEAGTAPAPPRPLPRGPMGPAPAAPPRGPAPSAPPAWRGRDPGRALRSACSAGPCLERRPRTHGLPRSASHSPPPPPPPPPRFCGRRGSSRTTLLSSHASLRTRAGRAARLSVRPSSACAFAGPFPRPLLSVCNSTSLHPHEHGFLPFWRAWKGHETKTWRTRVLESVTLEK